MTLSERRARRTRTYLVSYEKVDVWLAEVEASSKQEAAAIVRRGEHDIDQTVFDFHAGDGRILGVEREDA